MNVTDATEASVATTASTATGPRHIGVRDTGATRSSRFAAGTIRQITNPSTTPGTMSQGAAPRPAPAANATTAIGPIARPTVPPAAKAETPKPSPGVTRPAMAALAGWNAADAKPPRTSARHRV